MMTNVYLVWLWGYPAAFWVVGALMLLLVMEYPDRATRSEARRWLKWAGLLALGLVLWPVLAAVLAYVLGSIVVDAIARGWFD